MDRDANDGGEDVHDEEDEEDERDIDEEEEDDDEEDDTYGFNAEDDYIDAESGGDEGTGIGMLNSALLNPPNYNHQSLVRLEEYSSESDGEGDTPNHPHGRRHQSAPLAESEEDGSALAISVSSQ